MRCDSCGKPYIASKYTREGKVYFSKLCGKCNPNENKGYASTHEYSHGINEEPLTQIALNGRVKTEPL